MSTSMKGVFEKFRTDGASWFLQLGVDQICILKWAGSLLNFGAGIEIGIAIAIGCRICV